jgi:hypothetical protein
MAEELEKETAWSGVIILIPSLHHMGVEYHRGRIRASDDIIMQQSNLTRDRRSRSIIERRQWQVCTTIKSNKFLK